MSHPSRLSWAQVCARRLDRHGLGTPWPAAGPADAVAAMCGAHAQVLSAAELSIGIRLDATTRSDVREALWTERSLIKTFGPRGTVHLLRTRDLPMWTGALAAVPRRPNGLPDGVRLAAEQTEQIVAAITESLHDAELTVDELTAAIVAIVGSWAGDLVMPAFNGMWPRWRQAVTTAAHRGVLCFGANRGRLVTYTGPHRWSPGFRVAPADVALADLVGSYLHAYGPATPAHFAQWLSAPRGWAAELFDLLAGDLAQVEIDGTVSWVEAGDVTAASEPASGGRCASRWSRSGDSPPGSVADWTSRWTGSGTSSRPGPS